MDNYIVLDIPSIWDQLQHVANTVMTLIHDLFLPDKDDDEDAISLKKFLKKEVAWAVIKNVLGFDFDDNPGEHTICITEDFCTNILAIPDDKGLLSPCNQVLGKEPKIIFLHRNKPLFSAICDCHHLLKLPTKIPAP